MPQPPPLSRQWALAPFACTRRSDGWSSVWIQPTGELDLATCPFFEQVLKEAQDDASIVSIDLRELTFIDCAGLTVVVHAAARAAVTETRLILVGATGQVERLLDLTGPLWAVEVVKFDSAQTFSSKPAARGAATRQGREMDPLGAVSQSANPEQAQEQQGSSV